MSVLCEQRRALQECRRALYDYLDPKTRPKGVKDMRKRIYSALRHFPPLDKEGKPIWSMALLSRPPLSV